ncbi:MAG: hypothetical protein GQE15_15360 [Archangiaceae bacterium]|nr:hypothetical protein [Archangiaceae bacterium]
MNPRALVLPFFAVLGACSPSPLTMDAGGNGVDSGQVDSGLLQFNECDGGCVVNALATGSYFTCAELTDGLRCWGDDLWGQLALDLDGGLSTLPRRSRQTPRNFRHLAGGLYHACGVVGADVWCWGLNFFGQLGNGLFQNSTTPVRVTGLPSTIDQLVVGDYHSCVRSDGGVYCWGANGGLLGLGALDAGPSALPVQIQGLEPVAELSSAGSQLCALSYAGGVSCWGHASTGFTETPRGVPGWSSGVARVASGGSIDPHICVVVANGQIECVGPIATRGNLDAGVRPARVLGLSGPADLVAAGGGHTCALIDGGVECWGLTVSRVALPGRAESISAGFVHTCALVGQRAFCWGSNSSGQLGSERVPLRGFSTDPVPVGPWEL